MNLKQSFEGQSRNKRRAITIALAGSLALGGIGANTLLQTSKEAIHEVDERHDLSVPGLANNPEALAKVRNEHGPVTIVEVQHGTQNLTQLANEIGAINPNDVAQEMQVQVGDYMHIGDKVVFANDQIEQPKN